jgi:hypothetical protein
MLCGKDSIGGLISQLRHYRRATPFYADTIDFLEQVDVASQTCTTLLELNLLCLKAVRDYIGLSCGISVFFQMSLELGEVENAGDWALSISKAMGASGYVTPVGGRDIFVHGNFESSGIQLLFLEHNLLPYPQFSSSFEAGLSIIDVMMYNSKEFVQQYVADYILQ